MIQAGKLDRRGTLRAPTKGSDGQGGYTTKFDDVATVHAEYIRPSFRTLQEIGTVVSEVSQLYRIRYRSDVCRDWQFVEGGRTYDIVNVYQEGRREAVVLVCRELVK